jgi:hypothetical protein
VVEPAVAPHRRDHAERDAHGERHQQRGQGQLERGGHALDQVLQHGPAGGVTLTEVPARQAAEIAPVLDDHRLVQAHAPLHLRDVLRRGERPRFTSADCLAGYTSARR